MAFLFKSKKHQQSTPLPPATRNIHTSDGNPPVQAVNTSSLPDKDVGTQSPTPSGSITNSLHALGGGKSNSPEAQWPRSNSRAEAEAAHQQRRPNMNGQHPNAALYPWSQRRLNFPTPQSNPFPRYGAAVNSVASKEGDIYMMGGLINGSMVKGDLWMVEAGGGSLSCYSIATVSEGPGPRVGHASLLVGNAFIVFGGDTKMDDSDTLDDTLYLLNTSSRQWSRAAPPGPKPAGRYGHTLNILGSKIYIFGGQVEGYFFNDLLAFDLNALQNATNQWEFLMHNTADVGPAQGPVPPARTNHSIVTYNEQLYLFGGTDGTRWFNDVWVYDPKVNAWNQQDCIGYIPAPREGHSAALVQDVMYVFGGRTEEGTDLGDLAAFRISSRRWYTFQNMGPSPSPRSGHSMTAHGKSIIVLAGEPSSAPRDPAELSMVYVLDTGKIRYPTDQVAQPPAPKPESAGLPARNLSNDTKSAAPTGRSMSREGQTAHVPAGVSRMASDAKDPSHSLAVQTTRPNDNSGAPGLAWQQVPRGAVAQTPAGPPPQSQAPNPRMNGASPTSNTSRANLSSAENSGQAPAADPIKALSAESLRQSPVTRESPKDPPQAGKGTGRDASPGTSGRRTPIQQPALKAKAMEAGEAAPLVNGGPSRQRSLRSQHGHGSVDGSEDGLLGRSGSGKHHHDPTGDVRSLRSIGDEPRSPRLTPHQEALMKELEAAKNRNAWYASELALARKAGYHSSSPASATFDERAITQFGDEDRPLIEAFLAMRAELGKMQQTVEQQAASAAKRVAEIEHQRDAAVSEAAYARAKLAAHSGSQRSTPVTDTSRDADSQHERATDLSRRLAMALATQSEQKTKLDSIMNDLNSERRAREMAEEAADAAQRRLDEISQDRSPMELETLRAQLHEMQKTAREAAAQKSQTDEKVKMLQLQKDDLGQKHEGLSNRLADHTASLGALQAAVVASSDKAALLERHLDQERQQKELLEKRLVQLKGEHEERTTELEITSRRLRDSEELAETHAKEAATHREAFITGLSKATTSARSPIDSSLTDQRITVLQQSADRAYSLAKSNQEAADLASHKLRGAEERIAGLEAYQQQTSREGLQLRKQLQAALKDVKSLQNENRELKTRLETHQRETSALVVQHGALKDLLGERGINISDARRSPFDHSPGSRFGTPEQNRLRELEQQLQSSLKAHEETKQTFESREQEADRTYRGKLEQLENDYQSAVHYVKGTEKMLKRMKDELSKYKTQNVRLQSELEAAQQGERPDSAQASGMEEWANERSNLEKSIDEIKTQSNNQIAALESQLVVIRAELITTQSDLDMHKANHEQLSRSTDRTQSELNQLKQENSMLESRALDAEHKVTLLLDQVGQSVVNYRRQSHIAGGQHHGGANGLNHHSEHSSSTVTSLGGPEGIDASLEGGIYTDSRGSLALDSLASELDALRSHWESTNRNYRLSSQFDFERTPTKESSGGELSDSLANWRKRLDEEENGPKDNRGSGETA